MKWHKYFALCGICAPIFFTILILILGLTAPEYNYTSQFISELGEQGSDFENIISISLIIYGIFIFFFGIGLFKKMKNKKIAWTVPVLISLFALFAVIGSGFFPCDQACELSNSTGKTHKILNVIGFTALTFVPIATFISIRKDPNWKKLKFFSLIIQITGLAAFIIFIIEIEPFVGLLQRLHLGIYYIWIEVMAIRLLLLK